MTSKVLVKMPEPPSFTQVNNVKKSAAEVGPSSANIVSPGGLEAVLRVGQLEQNIRFLQEQHALLLSGLHREIDTLRQRNRDLQFQLVFSRRKSSTEDLTTSTTKEDQNESQKLSPTTNEQEKSPTSSESSKKNEDSERERCVRLETELTSTKAALQTSLARAADLQAQLQQYKSKEAASIQNETSRRIAESWSCGAGGETATTISSPSETVAAATAREEELRARLSEAERLVGGLRSQGERQRREVVAPPVGERGVTNLLFDTAAPVARNYLQSIKASLNAAGRGSNGGGGGNSRGTGPRGGQQRFPPLQPPQQQSYWQQREPPKSPNAASKETRKESHASKVGVAFGRSTLKEAPKITPRNNVTFKLQPTIKDSKSSVAAKNVTSRVQNGPQLSKIKQQKVTPSIIPNALKDKVNSPKNNEYGGWTRNNHRRGNDKNDPNPAAALPDLRATVTPLYNNGNVSNQSQGGSRRGGGGGNHGYSNQYFRNSERSHRNSDRNNLDEDQHPKVFTSPADLSDGEDASHATEGTSRGNHSYRHRRGHHNRQQDKT